MAYLAASLLMCLTFTGRALAKKRAQFLISVINDGPGWRLTIICCNPADIMYNNWVIKHPDGRVINHADTLDIMLCVWIYVCFFIYHVMESIFFTHGEGQEDICSSNCIICFFKTRFFFISDHFLRHLPCFLDLEIFDYAYGMNGSINLI